MRPLYGTLAMWTAFWLILASIACSIARKADEQHAEPRTLHVIGTARGNTERFLVLED